MSHPVGEPRGWWRLVLLLAMLGCSAPGPVVEQARPSILLVSIDTLRADHLGCYGYPRDTSPNIDRFASEAVVFDHFLNTGGGTLPVHMSMLTSLPPTVHQVLPFQDRALAAEHLAMAEILQERGYDTAAFTGGGFVKAKFGFARGFDIFDDEGREFAQILPKALAWLNKRGDRPFFLFLHTYDVHSDVERLPYDAPDGFNELFTDPDRGASFDGCRNGLCASELLSWVDREIRRGTLARHSFFSAEELQHMVDLYDGGIAYADREFGRLLDRVRQLGLYESSIIVLTSDHGEEFEEHGRVLHHQNYEEVARVPFLLKLPEASMAGLRIAALASTLEVMPTILDAAGIAPPAGIFGRSLLPLLEDPSRTGRPHVYVARGGLEKLRTAEWSLKATPERPVELFDLRTDPREQHNVIHQHPDLAAQLFETYIHLREAELRRQIAREDSEKNLLTDQELEQLRSLGYLNDG